MGRIIGAVFSFVRGHVLWISILAAAIVGAGYYFFFYKASQDSASTGSIQTAEAKRMDIRNTVTGSGQVFAENQVDLQPVAAGDAIEVKSVNVKNDQEVKKGDLIAVLDTRDAEKAVRDAELSLRSAEIKMRQTVKEADTKSEGDKLTRQTQEVALAQARNRLADAREELLDYRVRAPFDGVVTGLSVSVGDSVSRDDTIASVITKGLYASILLNEIDAANVRIGNAVTLSFDALGGKKVGGKVSKIDTIGTVQQNVVSYGAEIAFDEPVSGLKPGMSVDVEIVIEEKKGVVAVPNAAVKSDASGKYVLVPKTDAEIAEMNARNADPSATSSAQPKGTGTGAFRNLSYRPVTVEVGISGDAFTEIVSGISEGATVITAVPSASSGTGTQSSTQRSTGSSSLIPAGAGAGTGLRLH